MRTGIVASLAFGFILALYLSLNNLISNPGPNRLLSTEKMAASFPLPNHVEFSVFSNDSIGDIIVAEGAERWDTSMVQYSFDIYPVDLSCFKIVWDSLLYAERWDTLNQTIFWRKVMNLRRDSVIVSIAGNREIVDIMPFDNWEERSDSLKEFYKDSIRLAKSLSPEAGIYVTAGKKFYYDFDKVIPSIGKAVHIFTDLKVDPWYAQAILLIESPGKLQYSPVGAYGSFQLMKAVALEHGLVVNDSIDEREDFSKAARAAAALITRRCLPQTRYMLRKRNIEFNESDLWFRLLVLHSYHAGAGNVDGVLEKIGPSQGGMELMKQVWKTEYKGFKNASQNYSQVALASLLELDHLLASMPDTVCRDTVFLWKDELADLGLQY